MWFKDCVQANVSDDLLGELHLPELSAGETVRIGGRIGDAPDPHLTEPGDVCGCIPGSIFCFYFPSAFEEDSPRDCDYADRGAVRIRQVAGLAGQVTINANYATPRPPDSDLWKGMTTIGDLENGSAPAITISPSAAQPFQAPYYEAKAQVLGGGAIGLAAFHLHQKDCRPPHNSNVASDFVLESAFDNANMWPVEPTGYGPLVRAAGYSNWNQAVRIDARSLNSDPCSRYQDVTMGFKVRGPGDAGWLLPRSLGLSRATNAHPRPGIYRVVVLDDEFEGGVACKDVTDNPPVAWEKMCAGQTSAAEGVYIFTIGPDCDGDHELDAPFGTDTTTSSCAFFCANIEFDGNPGISLQDLFDFLAVYFATPSSPNNCWIAPQPRLPADVNNSGCVTVEDIFAFLAAYFSEACRA